MLDLNINLENKKSYISWWNYFSKSVILKDNIEKILLVVENDKIISIYEKLFRFFWKNLIQIYKNAYLTDFVLNNSTWFFVVSFEELANFDLNLYDLKKSSLYLEKDKEYELNELIWKLNTLWYSFSEYWHNWSYKKIWDLVYVISFDWKKEYTLSFWWNLLENIWEKEKVEDIFFKDRELNEIYIWSDEDIRKIELDIKNKNIYSLLNESNAMIVFDCMDFHKNYEFVISQCDNFCSFDYIWQRKNVIDLEIKDLDIDNVDSFKDKLNEAKNKTVFTKNKKLVDNFTNLNNISNYQIFESKESLMKSFETNDSLIICDDIISKVFIKRRIKRKLSEDLNLLLKISVWDYIVHIDHWIGIFNWIVTKDLNKIKREYIEIEYKDNDKLYVPITEVWRVSKYIWDSDPELTWLNTREWERKMERVNEDVERIAQELLETYAKRTLDKWFKFERFKEQERLFQKNFPYIYTEDQARCIEEILNDMNSLKNMDRLLVWDVGFGKTEVAFNAIFTSIINKKQACFISPLVVLAYEHYEKAQERFAWFNIKIEILTRLETAKHTKEVLKRLEEWKVDLVIWTHKLLSENVVFKNLWLIVVDEEHKFWVEDKEKIKKVKIKVDTLSMSATPIPRSLNMALSNIRDISILKEWPIWRKSIKTIVTKYDESVILEWCKNELSRNWQIFFIHNRIENIDIIQKQLSTILPWKKIVVTHGRLTWDEIEDRIIDFKNKKYDILLSTTLIENGIDFANVNTIFINNCENFWLSQIHQLRWRVGRSDRQGYCYLLYKKDNIDKDAAKRLKTIIDYSFLWAWFEIAMKDLEIRWWWDILGIKQSGQNKYISVNIFLELLEKKVYELKNNKEKTIDTMVDLNIECFINDQYFNSETDKINFYKEIESLENLEDLDLLIEDFKNMNLSISHAEQNLFDTIRLRIIASKYKITSIKKVWINYQIDFDSSIKVDDLKKFLELDKEVLFAVVSIDKIRTSIKNFENDQKFLQYLLSLFDNKIHNKKIKLISKKWLWKKTVS